MESKTDAVRSLQNGRTYPYDSPKDGEAPPEKDWAHGAARGVLADLSDRRGIKWELEKVDADVRVEIVGAIASIIRLAANPGDFSEAYDLADKLYRAGWEDRHNERDYDPRGRWEWQHVADAITGEDKKPAAPTGPAQPDGEK